MWIIGNWDDQMSINLFLNSMSGQRLDELAQLHACQACRARTLKHDIHENSDWTRLDWSLKAI